MATVKILYNNTSQHLERYLLENQERATEDKKPLLQTEHSVFLDGMSGEFQQVQSHFATQGNTALHLIQSWSPHESQAIPLHSIHEMGVALAQRFAPGHQFVVQTHTDQPHYHNHILINPVHPESGKRIQNKLEHVRTLRTLNDELARERGLSVLPAQSSLWRPGPNEKAKRIEAYRGKSYIVDLCHKADFARAHATDFTGYVNLLSGFDIDVKVENKNTVYFYPGRAIGKRGRNLAPEYDKQGLEKRFLQNLEKIAQQPSLEETLIPREEIEKAKAQSILRYCHQEKVALTENEAGQTVLLNRTHLEVSDYTWKNHRNKTQGTLIDFVANHRKVTLLRALSLINDNPNLMLLEQHLGAVTRNTQTFQVPFAQSAPQATALNALSQFFSLIGQSGAGQGHLPSVQYSALLHRQRVQVTEDLKIRFFPEKDLSGFLEYLPENERYEQKKVHGTIHSPFFSHQGSSRSLLLFLDPKIFLQSRPEALSGKIHSSDSTLVLLEPNLALVHQALAARKQIQEVRLINPKLASGEKTLLDFFSLLQASLDPFSIDATLAWESFDGHRSSPQLEVSSISL